jgi:hypothetical protein
MEPDPATAGDDAALSWRVRALGLGLLGLVVALYAWWPVLAAWELTQWGDGQYFHKVVEAFRVSVVHHHELPLWDPYECGGRPLWDNPQGLAGAPLIWFSLFIGTTAAMKLWYVAHTAAGFVCMWLFCRRDLGVSRAAAFASSTAWACAGFHMHHLSGGHAAFVGFEYMPLALWLWRRGEQDHAGAIWLGLLVALMGFEGGALPLLYVAVLLGSETLMRVWPPRRLLKIVRAGAITLVVGVGCGAIRLFPVIDQLRMHKRPLGPDLDHMTLTSVVDAFVNRHFGHMQHIPDHVYVWGEYGAYIGWILLLLGLLGIALGRLKNAWLAALLALAIALMVGYHGRLSPWGILNKWVYPLKEMRVPSRFSAQATLVLLAYAALAIDRLAELLGKLPARLPRIRFLSGAVPPFQLVLPLIAVLGAGDVVGRGMQLIHEYGAVSAPQNTKIVPSARLYFGGADSAASIDQPRQNRGRIGCYDPWAFYEGAPLWEGDLPQAKSKDPAVHVSEVTRTQNTFRFDVETAAPARIVLNSSFDYNWRSDVGVPTEENKQLVVDVPSGTHHVRVYYRPRLLVLGSIVSLVFFAIVIRTLLRLSAKRRRAATP